MALLTFLSDFGSKDHYVAAVKAAVLKVNQGLNVVDLGHDIEPFNIAQGGFVLRSVFNDFAKGTVHLVSVHADGNRSYRPVAAKIEDHFFVGVDNGLLSLISGQPPMAIIDLAQLHNTNTPFLARDVLAPVAAKLASGKDLYEMGSALEGLRAMMNPQLKATPALISGHVVYVDNYGNLITNIEKAAFDALRKDRPFEIRLGRDTLTELHQSPDQVPLSGLFAYFNSQDLLLLGLNQGSAAQLLGKGYESPVMIKFK